MFERFTDEARAIVVQAREQAKRLGHRYVGCEHLLLAAVSMNAPAAEVMHEHGVTAERVEEVIVRRIGLGAGAGLFTGLDTEALATIGIDLDAVRARIEASFGTEALIRADQIVHGPHKRRRWRRFRIQRPVNVDAAGRYLPVPAGRYRLAPAVPSPGRLSFTPRAKKVLERSLRQAVSRHDNYIGAEHIMLALVGMENGMVRPILADIGVPPQLLRTAIQNRYRQAS
jgi:ATP-dependent Clp protease ATP-binding subunit ClpA